MSKAAARFMTGLLVDVLPPVLLMVGGKMMVVAGRGLQAAGANLERAGTNTYETGRQSAMRNQYYVAPAPAGPIIPTVTT